MAKRSIHMNLNEYKEQTVQTVITPMRSFIEEWDDCDYTTEDIEACKSLIFAYLDEIFAMTEPTDEAIMEQVKILVLGLNALNEQVDYAMIETGEREAIWEIIQSSAIACGLKEYSDDITEQWREW